MDTGHPFEWSAVAPELSNIAMGHAASVLSSLYGNDALWTTRPVAEVFPAPTEGLRIAHWKGRWPGSVGWWTSLEPVGYDPQRVQLGLEMAAAAAGAALESMLMMMQWPEQKMVDVTHRCDLELGKQKRNVGALWVRLGPASK